MTTLEKTLARRVVFDARFVGMESPIEHRDVTTIMALLGDIHYEVRKIRILLEDENGEEEEAPENHT